MIYVDTSVAVSLLVQEMNTLAVKTWFAQVDGVLVSSDWILTEFTSALSLKVRSGGLSETGARAVRKEFEALTESGLRIVPVSRSAFGKAADLASHHSNGLRAGDALHLAVALEIGAKAVATLDGAMIENARRLKLPTEEF